MIQCRQRIAPQLSWTWKLMKFCKTLIKAGLVLCVTSTWQGTRLACKGTLKQSMWLDFHTSVSSVERPMPPGTLWEAIRQDARRNIQLMGLAKKGDPLFEQQCSNNNVQNYIWESLRTTYSDVGPRKMFFSLRHHYMVLLKQMYCFCIVSSLVRLFLTRLFSEDV